MVFATDQKNKCGQHAMIPASPCWAILIVWTSHEVSQTYTTSDAYVDDNDRSGCMQRFCDGHPNDARTRLQRRFSKDHGVLGVNTQAYVAMYTDWITAATIADARVLLLLLLLLLLMLLMSLMLLLVLLELMLLMLLNNTRLTVDQYPNVRQGVLERKKRIRPASPQMSEDYDHCTTHM